MTAVQPPVTGPLAGSSDGATCPVATSAISVARSSMWTQAKVAWVGRDARLRGRACRVGAGSSGSRSRRGQGWPAGGPALASSRPPRRGRRLHRAWSRCSRGRRFRLGRSPRTRRRCAARGERRLASEQWHLGGGDHLAPPPRTSTTPGQRSPPPWVPTSFVPTDALVDWLAEHMARVGLPVAAPVRPPWPASTRPPARTERRKDATPRCQN